MSAAAFATAVGLVTVSVLGLLIGSFLNVVAYRVPAGLSVVTPRSACPRCGTPIRAYDNVPVLSWILLGGRCRDCRGPIAIRYPLVEAGVGVAFGLVAWWRWPSIAAATGSGGAAVAAELLELAAFLYLAAITVVLAIIDLETRTLPNRIVLPAYPVSAVLLVASALLAGQPGVLLVAAVGCAGAFALYLALALGVPGGMGLGDVKLAGVLGLYLGWLGWGPLLVGIFAAFVLGSLWGIALVVVRRARRSGGIPFGPWMLAGAWVGVLWGPAIAAAYLALFGLN